MTTTSPSNTWTFADKPEVEIKAPNLEQIFQLYGAVTDHTTVIGTALLQPNQKQIWKKQKQNQTNSKPHH